MADDRVAVRDAERLGRGQKLIHLRVANVRIHNRNARQIFKVFIKRRHIVTEVVEFKYGIMQSVEVEMRCTKPFIRVIRRVLYGSEILRLHIAGHNNHAAGVLTRCSLNAYTASCEPVFFGAADGFSSLFKPLFNKAVCGFICKGTYCARLENMRYTEKSLCISVSIELIFTAEVEVNIGLFIAFKSEESFKRYIVTVSVHRYAAVGAILGRQVKARAHAAVCEELAVLALFAHIVRRQRVNLRNSRGVSDKGRAYAASRADVIAVLLRVFNKLLGYHIKNAESVGYN